MNQILNRKQKLVRVALRGTTPCYELTLTVSGTIPTKKSVNGREKSNRRPPKPQEERREIEESIQRGFRWKEVEKHIVNGRPIAQYTNDRDDPQMAEGYYIPPRELLSKINKKCKDFEKHPFKSTDSLNKYLLSRELFVVATPTVFDKAGQICSSYARSPPAGFLLHRRKVGKRHRIRDGDYRYRT